MHSHPVKLVQAERFEDDRGWFSEIYNRARFEKLGIECNFVQDNHSLSRSAGTLRGLHFQLPPYAQDKLVRCIRGRIFDVAVDLRAGSPTFGQWAGTELSAANGAQLFIPVGFAHGFITLEDNCEVVYKCSAFYAPDCDAGIAWDDPQIGISWPIAPDPALMSDKDQRQPKLSDLDSPFAYDGRPLMQIA